MKGATGVVWLSMRLPRECVSRSRRPCSPLLRCHAGRESGRDIVLACPIFAAKPPLYPADGDCAA
jgi:hypothetical protein